MPDNGWERDAKLVHSELQRLSRSVEKIDGKVDGLCVQVAELKSDTRARQRESERKSILGGTGGGAAVSAVISFLHRLFS